VASLHGIVLKDDNNVVQFLYRDARLEQGYHEIFVKTTKAREMDSDRCCGGEHFAMPTD